MTVHPSDLCAAIYKEMVYGEIFDSDRVNKPTDKSVASTYDLGMFKQDKTSIIISLLSDILNTQCIDCIHDSKREKFHS